MNIEPELPPNDGLDLNLLVTESEQSGQTQALTDAQEELAQLKDKRREERMGWIVLMVIVVDCFLFLDAKNWSGPIVIGLLEIGALSVIAARLGVEEFKLIFDGMLTRVTHLISGRG